MRRTHLEAGEEEVGELGEVEGAAPQRAPLGPHLGARGVADHGGAQRGEHVGEGHVALERPIGQAPDLDPAADDGPALVLRGAAPGAAEEEGHGVWARPLQQMKERRHKGERGIQQRGCARVRLRGPLQQQRPFLLGQRERGDAHCR